MCKSLYKNLRKKKKTFLSCEKFSSVAILTTIEMLGCKLKWFIPPPYNTDMFRSKDNLADTRTDGALQYIALFS